MLLHGLESLMRLLLLGRSGIEHRTLRCCDFHSVLFVPSTLRVSGAASLALGEPFRSGSRLGRDSRLGTPWMLL